MSSFKYMGCMCQQKRTESKGKVHVQTKVPRALKGFWKCWALEMRANRRFYIQVCYFVAQYTVRVITQYFFILFFLFQKVLP